MKDRKGNPARAKVSPRVKDRTWSKTKAGQPRIGRADETEAKAADGERIAKRLARAGVASRRDAEAMIAAGRVRVNGRLLQPPAFNVRASDRIEVDGEPLPTIERTRLFLFHKPAGVVTTTRDPEGRKTIFDVLPPGLPRLISVGRLDITTEGLLLLTNDGGLARILELPSTGWLRRYRVRVHGKVDPLALADLEKGIAVDGVYYGAISATMDRQQGSNAWLTLGLREGKNREVRNVLGALGLDVTRLIRISYGPFQLGDVPEGAVQEIKGRTLRDQLGDRLVEAAGANFDAPVTRPFANKAKPAEVPQRSTAGTAARGPKTGRRKSEADRREEMRDRLHTKRPEHGRKGVRAGRTGDEAANRTGEDKKPKRPPIERRSRASNVWMAPGARPVGRKREEVEEPKPRQRSGADRKSEGRRKDAKPPQKRSGPSGGRRPRSGNNGRNKP